MKRLATSIIALLVPALVAAQATGSAVFAGTVVDSLQKPLPNAEVSFPTLAISRVTDENGNFRLTGLPAGAQRLLVRRIGYGQLDTSIVLTDGQTQQRRITLGRIVRLDSVVVKAAANLDPIMAAFEENRAKGFGRFITRDQLEKQEGNTLSAVMAGVQGVALFRGAAGQTWIVSKRSPNSRCPAVRPGVNGADAREQQRITDDCLRSERLYYVPSDADANRGMKRACYALVYLDRAALNPGHPTEPFDVNSYLTTQIEAVEWYESDAQIPSLYTAADARCGLLVLHRRRG